MLSFQIFLSGAAPGPELPMGHQSDIVALSVAVAVLASFTALQIAGRLADSRGGYRALWLGVSACAMGSGIWAMHFIAMMAMTLPIPVSYDAGRTASSLAIAVGVTAIGLALNARRGAGLSTLLVSGAVMGLGVAAMHYTGMAAMRTNAEVFYRPSLFVASIAIAVVASTVALKLASRERNVWRKMVAAPAMGAAIAGMHYTAMAGTVFVAGPTAMLGPLLGAPQTELALTVAAGAAALMCLGLVSASVDRRFAAVAAREAEVLKRSRRRFQAMLENSSDPIFLIDGDRRIRSAVVPTLDCTETELIGRDLLDLVDSDHWVETAAVLRDFLRDGTAVPHDTRLVETDGAPRDYELLLRDLRDDPAVAAVVVTLHDVTERKQIADQMRIAKELADQASRAKSQFIANMSHELRTPLNAIIGFSEIMEQESFGALGNAHYRDYAADIRISGHHLLGLVNNVLDIGRIEAGELKLNEDWLDSAALLHDSTSLVRNDADRRGIAVEVVMRDHPQIYGDEQKLRQILVNLLANAIKFSPDKSLVTVEIRKTPAWDLAITVCDRGDGIPEGELERVRKPFVQADGSLSRRHEGSGLGLAIADGLARLHDGELILDSRVGEGTEVTLRLPQSRIAGTETSLSEAQTA